MRAAVDDVHHRHRQLHIGAAPLGSDRAEARFIGGCLGTRHRDSRDRIGPRRDLDSVPSSSIMVRSMNDCSEASSPTTFADFSVDIFAGFHTPLPRKREASLSATQWLARAGGRAEGHATARPITPDSRSTSASTVGLPRSPGFLLRRCQQLRSLRILKISANLESAPPLGIVIAWSRFALANSRMQNPKQNKIQQWHRNEQRQHAGIAVPSEECATRGHAATGRWRWTRCQMLNAPIAVLES